MQVLSTTLKSQEPTLSYAPNGTLWYSGATTTPGTGEGYLWWASSDTATFVQDSDPPTSGAADAVVHHDLGGKLFWAEINGFPDGGRNTELGMRQSGAWTTQILGFEDRPWFRTLPSGDTFLAAKNRTTIDRIVNIWKFDSGIGKFVHWSTSVLNPGSLADFANHTDGRMYVLMKNESSEGYLVAHRTTSSAWTYTPEFTINQPRSIPRLAVDLSGKVYVVADARIGAAYVVFLRYFDGTTWSSERVLCESGKTCSKPGVASGTSGKLGVGWYETDGDIDPENAPDNTIWRFKYNLVTNADTSPSVQRATVAADSNKASIRVGDFSFAVRRTGDGAGKVALAFSCNNHNVDLGCIQTGATYSPYPVYAVQTSGDGLLG